MADVTVKAHKRTEFGKGASRRNRRDGLTPAVLYGHGTDPVHLTLPAKELFLSLRHANALFELVIDGEPPLLALPKQVQRHAILPEIEHVDFILVRKGEKVAVDIPLVQTGEAERGSIINTEIVNLPVLAPATDIPAELEISVEGLKIGDNVYVSDVKLPEGVVADIDAEAIVLSILAPSVEEPTETEVAEGETAEGAEEE